MEFVLSLELYWTHKPQILTVLGSRQSHILSLWTPPTQDYKKTQSYFYLTGANGKGFQKKYQLGNHGFRDPGFL